jgi:hypothetical protein
MEIPFNFQQINVLKIGSSMHVNYNVINPTVHPSSFKSTKAEVCCNQNSTVHLDWSISPIQILFFYNKTQLLLI